MKHLRILHYIIIFRINSFVWYEFVLCVSVLRTRVLTHAFTYITHSLLSFDVMSVILKRSYVSTATTPTSATCTTLPGVLLTNWLTDWRTGRCIYPPPIEGLIFWCSLYVCILWRLSLYLRSAPLRVTRTGTSSKVMTAFSVWMTVLRRFCRVSRRMNCGAYIGSLLVTASSLRADPPPPLPGGLLLYVFYVLLYDYCLSFST